MLKDLSLKEYCQTLASSSPTPGGGSSLALVGANCACLAEMAANVTLAKLAKVGQTSRQLQEAAKSLENCKEKFLRLVDDDAAAFEKIIAAMRLPKTTDEEKALRRAVLQDSYVFSADVCLQTVETAKTVNALAAVVEGLSDAYVKSDAVIGKKLAAEVARLAEHNVRANTDYVDPPANAAPLLARLVKALQDLKD